MRILIVDDIPALGKVLTRILKDHDTLYVDSVEAARDAVARQPFDLVLSDVMLGRETGADLHRWLTEHHPHLAARAVFLTGCITDPEAADYIMATGNQVIAKPFTVEEVRAAVGGATVL